MPLLIIYLLWVTRIQGTAMNIHVCVFRSGSRHAQQGGVLKWSHAGIFLGAICILCWTKTTIRSFSWRQTALLCPLKSGEMGISSTGK